MNSGWAGMELSIVPAPHGNSGVVRSASISKVSMSKVSSMVWSHMMEWSSKEYGNDRYEKEDDGFRGFQTQYR